MRVIIQGGETISIDIETSNTVEDVKRQIQQLVHIPPNEQLLVAHDRELENNRTLSTYGIKNHSDIYLIHMKNEDDDSDPSPISRITVKTEEGGRIHVDVSPSCKIKDIKQRIMEQANIPLDEQCLVIGDAEGDDAYGVSYYNINDGSTIHLLRLTRQESEADDPSPTVPFLTTGAGSLSKFYLACRDNDINGVQQLLQTLSIDDINRLEPNGSTALHVACFRGHQDVVKLLLQKGVSRSIMNKYRCLPYEEAASDAIKQLFDRIPGNSRYVGNSGRLEWVLVSTNAQAMAARKLAAAQQCQVNEFKNYTKQIIDKYIKPYFHDVQNYPELLEFFNLAYKENDPKYLLKAYTAETGFYTKLNVDLASDDDIGKAERKLYVGMLTFHPFFDQYRFRGEVYRGMRLTDDDLNEYAVGKQIMTKTFLSATTERSEAEYFVGKVKRTDIKGKEIKMGVLCTYIIKDQRISLDIHRLSEYPKEKEVLIFPYAVFTVTNIERDTLENENIRIAITLTQHCPDLSS